MNDIYDVYQSISDSIEELDDFRIYDFIYYLGINSVDKDIPKEEIEKYGIEVEIQDFEIDMPEVQEVRFASPVARFLFL